MGYHAGKPIESVVCCLNKLYFTTKKLISCSLFRQIVREEILRVHVACANSRLPKRFVPKAVLQTFLAARREERWLFSQTSVRTVSRNSQSERGSVYMIPE